MGLWPRRRRARRSASPTPRSQQHGQGSPPCARSKISSWRDGALYPLAGRRRARRRIKPELEATAPPIPFWFYRVVAGAAEPWGQLRRRRACNNTVVSDPPSLSRKMGQIIFIPNNLAALLWPIFARSVSLIEQLSNHVAISFAASKGVSTANKILSAPTSSKAFSNACVRKMPLVVR